MTLALSIPRLAALGPPFLSWNWERKGGPREEASVVRQDLKSLCAISQESVEIVNTTGRTVFGWLASACILVWAAILLCAEDWLYLLTN